MFKQEIILRFLYQVFLSNLKVAFKEGIFFDMLNTIIPDVLHHFKPKRHERLTTVLGLPVILGDPYFKALEISTISLSWYKTLI